MKNKLNVMVTGVGGGGVGEQILKCLRLADAEYYVIGGDMSRSSKGLANVDVAYILPPANDKAYIDTLIKVCKKHDVKALFYGSEAELKVMSLNRQVFIDNGIFVPLNPMEVIELCMDKNKTMSWLSNKGFKMPNSYKVNKIEDLYAINCIPAVLKPSVYGGGSNNTFIAQSKEELVFWGTYLLKSFDEFIIQEYVGTPETEYTVGVMHDMQGNYINAIAVKKHILSGLSNRTKVINRTGIDTFGSTLAISSGISQGEIGRFPEVTKKCSDIVKKMGCTGPVNIQCRIHNNDIYVFEINPRISGTASLRALVGYNEPDVMIRKHIFGEYIEQDFEYKSGVIARGLEESFISDEFMNSVKLAKDL